MRLEVLTLPRQEECFHPLQYVGLCLPRSERTYIRIRRTRHHNQQSRQVTPHLLRRQLLRHQHINQDTEQLLVHLETDLYRGVHGRAELTMFPDVGQLNEYPTRIQKVMRVLHHHYLYLERFLLSS